MDRVLTFFLARDPFGMMISSDSLANNALMSVEEDTTQHLHGDESALVVGEFSPYTS